MENSEENPNEDPMDDGEGTGPNENQVRVEMEEPTMEEQCIPRGTRPIVISTRPLMMRTSVVAWGCHLYTRASSSRAPPTNSKDRDSIREYKLYCDIVVLVEPQAVYLFCVYMILWYFVRISLDEISKCDVCL